MKENKCGMQKEEGDAQLDDGFNPVYKRLRSNCEVILGIDASENTGIVADLEYGVSASVLAWDHAVFSGARYGIQEKSVDCNQH